VSEINTATNYSKSAHDQSVILFSPGRSNETAPRVKFTAGRASSLPLPAKIKIRALRVTIRPTALIARKGLKRLPLIPRDDEVLEFVGHE
jgi:hypothetical protein